MSGQTPLRRRVELTDRQREVLALIERGCTNYEIAQALGISLEGAKYHIREIMTKLGADSREEAVQLWRERERARRRPSLRAIFALPWVRIAGAAGAAAIVVAVVVAALAFADGDERGQRVLVAHTNTGLPLLVLDGGGNEVFRAEGAYLSPRFSPDGTRLAAIVRDEVSEQKTYIDIYDTSDWTSIRYEPGGELLHNTIGWSPDSTLLAIVPLDRVVLLDRDGREVASTDQLLPPAPDTRLQPPLWAPDSHRLAASIQGKIFVVSRTGDAALLEDPEADPEQNLAAVRWTSPNEFVVVDFSAGQDAIGTATLVNLQDPAATTWTATTPEVVLGPRAEAFDERLQNEFPNHYVTELRPRADRQGHMAVVFEALTTPADQRPELQLVLEGLDRVVPLGPMAVTWVFGNVDAVVIRD